MKGQNIMAYTHTFMPSLLLPLPARIDLHFLLKSTRHKRQTPFSNMQKRARQARDFLYLSEHKKEILKNRGIPMSSKKRLSSIFHTAIKQGELQCHVVSLWLNWHSGWQRPTITLVSQGCGLRDYHNFFCQLRSGFENLAAWKLDLTANESLYSLS